MNYSRLFSLLLIVLVLGCSEFIKGDKKNEEVLKFSNDRFACLNGVPETLRNIVSAQSQPEKLEEVLSCVESSLTYFKKRTKGTVAEGYSIQDIRTFFGKYLGDRDRVSDEMAEQMMKMKRALFGGNEQVIAKTELQSLINFIASARLEVQNLKEQWDIIIVKPGLKPDKKMLALSQHNAKEAITRLILRTSLVQSDYTFSDFKALIEEAEKFVKRSPEKTKVSFTNWIDIVESVKVHLFSDKADLNSSGRWKEAIRMVMELHKIYGLYEYHYKGYEFYSLEAFQTGDELISTVIKLLESSWWMDKGGIPFKETHTLLTRLAEENLLPANTTPETIMEAYRTIVKRMLDRRIETDIVSGLDRSHILTLKGEYRGFKAIQDFNNSMPKKFQYSQLLQQLNKRSVFQSDLFSETSDDVLSQVRRDWEIHLNQPNPLVYLETGELLLDRDVQASQAWTWASLTRLNMMRFLNRVLMLSFGMNRTMDLTKETLNEDSMRRFYAEFWEFGKTLKAFDPRSGNSGKRTYFEADHFVYAGNGNETIDLQESFELVNIIFSAGLSGLNRIQKDLHKSSCALKELDYFKNPWLEETCFKKILRQNFGDYFKNLTGLKNWVSGLSDEQWDQFYTELINFSRAKPETVGKIETGDLRSMVVIAHYIESMYIKFDKDGDDRLSITELIEGSNRFTPFFKQLFNLKPKGPFFKEEQEEMINFAISRGFACMVLTGEMPGLDNCTPSFVKNWVSTKQYSNRTLILRTLNAFKSSIK